MIVAITGGTGFIGKALVLRHLELGDEVRVLSRQASGLPDSVRWHKGDLLNFENLLSFVEGAEVLYHSAGQLTDTSIMRSLHVDATRRLTELASTRIAHWVQLSSVGVYGPVSSGVITERSILNPAGEYEITKTESDRIVLDAAQKGAFTCTILRPSIVFGAKMKNRSLFSMIEMIDRGLFFFIGKPGASANYIHVDNVAEALVRCATQPQAKDRIYNLSDYRTMEEFVGAIALCLGKPAPGLRIPASPAKAVSRIFGRISGFPLTPSRVDALTNRSVYSIDMIRQELGYEHIVSMKIGIHELVKAYRNRRL